MNSDQLKETTLNPKTRTLLRVDIESAIEADAIFAQLLGKDASERYKLIMEQAGTPTIWICDGREHRTAAKAFGRVADDRQLMLRLARECVKAAWSSEVMGMHSTGKRSISILN